MSEEKRPTALTPEQQKSALEKLESVWKKDISGQRKCEICGTGNWTVSQDLITPIVMSQGGGINLGGTSYPQIQVICTTCGNTKYFNAVVLKIHEPEKKEEKNG